MNWPSVKWDKVDLKSHRRKLSQETTITQNPADLAEKHNIIEVKSPHMRYRQIGTKTCSWRRFT